MSSLAMRSKLADQLAVYFVADPEQTDRDVRDVVSAAIANGVTIVQLRAKTMADGEFRALAVDLLAICRERGVAFHVDAAQSAGKVPLDVEAMNVDLLSLTAHKIYGPKGIGALYVRRRPPLGLKPLIYGGGQEHGLRSGTLATHQIVGMGMAFEIANRERLDDVERIKALRERLWQGIASLGDVELNGHPEHRVAGLLNVSFHGVEGESLQFALRELAVSAGSACSSASEEASYVLRALGRSDQLAQSSLRFSLGRFTTAEQIETAIDAVKREVSRLRALSVGAQS